MTTMKMFGAAGLLAAMAILAGCGGGSDSGAAPAAVTMTTGAATTATSSTSTTSTTVAAGTTTTAAATTTTASPPTTSTVASTTTTTALSGAALGKALFNDPRYCIQCHTPAQRAGRTADQIKSAIAGVAPMGFLSVLTDAQIAAIAEFLAHPELF